jgi:hypothetical protein
MKEHVTPAPFYSAHEHLTLTPQQAAGPCALAMALRALGWDLTPVEIWNEVRVGEVPEAEQDAPGGQSTLSRLTLYAQKHGFQAVIVRGGLGSVQGLLGRGVQVVAAVRTAEQLWAAGAKLLLEITEREVTFHDPLNGPRRTLPRDEFEKLLTAHHQHPGHCFILVASRAQGVMLDLEALGGFSNPQLQCPSCSAIPPEMTYTCEDCRQTFRHGPGFPLGCPNPRCPTGYWSFVRCVACGEEVTLI